MVSERRPLRLVTASVARSGRGSLLGGDTWRRVRVWNLTLDCGHHIQRSVKYRPGTGDLGGPGSDHSLGDLLPAPRRARCDFCSAHVPEA